MSLSPFDYIKSINKGQHIDKVEGDYSPWLIAYNFSLFADTVFQANQVNLLSEITPQMHYDILAKSIRPGNRFKKWPKKDKITGDNIRLIKHHYKYSTQKAVEALKILTDSQIDEIRKQQEEGGTSK